MALAVVFGASVVLGSSPLQSAQWFGAGFWDLVAFTMQVTMLIASGFALANAPPVHAVIRRMARIPNTPKGAAAFVALFSMLSSLISWTFSLIFSGLLAREVAHRVRGADYRAVGAAAYLGVGGVWAFGLTSSAALIMAAPASLPQSILRISGVIPLSATIGLWQSSPAGGDSHSGFSRDCVITLGSWRPRRRGACRTWASAMRLILRKFPRSPSGPASGWSTARCRRSFSPRWALRVILVREVAGKGAGVLLELNHYIFAFLVAGLLLHWRPRSFARAIADAVPSVSGVLIQYPIYAGIVRIMTESSLATRLAHFFVSASTQHSFPALIGIYSVVLGLFIPSAGGKWLIEAPYVLEAAKALHVHLGWVVQTYNATESLANLIHPFWMLPLLGILSLKARDIVGYAMLQFIVHVPLVLFLVWSLNYTLQYVAPNIPH